ncbi:hypothetical protein ABZR86_12470 [Dyella marensis]|jgi:hypothetical protein|uniref:Uncharacterized protein n=1 Tax=Dyella marensis TaxID=500610 RepID=A0A1I2JHY1_9GAMM|nr:MULTISPECIES: hypothetical protein [Dyella]SFF52426.1 hypothetical protein SAMN02799615_03978 [Dyella marensis]
MQNVTELMSDYRNALVTLWNFFFRKHYVSLMSCGPLDDYESIERKLFAGLVLKPALGSDGAVARLGAEAKAVLVNPNSDNVEVMLGDLVDGYYKWSLPISIRTDAYSFGYIELFEFDRYGQITLPYVKCQIISSGKSVESASFALLKYEDCQFFL